MKKIAAVFCGGCDPLYDRVELLKRIRDSLGERTQWTTTDDSDCDAILVVNGCLRACRDKELSGLTSLKLISVKEGDVNKERILIQLLKLMGGDDD